MNGQKKDKKRKMKYNDEELETRTGTQAHRYNLKTERNTDFCRYPTCAT